MHCYTYKIYIEKMQSVYEIQYEFVVHFLYLYNIHNILSNQYVLCIQYTVSRLKQTLGEN